MSSIDLLALALWLLKSRCALMEICFLLGITPSSASAWLNYSLEALWRAAKDRSNKDFEATWPTPAEMALSAALLQKNRANGAALKGIFGVTEGGRMPRAEHANQGLQNVYYEGHASSAEVTDLLAFNFFGELAHAAVNYPGSWHGARLAGAPGLHRKLLSDEKAPPGFAILGGSAFVNDTKLTNGKVARGRKANEASDIPESAALAAVGLALQRAMPSGRQSAEWGARAPKGPFARLKAPLPARSRKRLKIIQARCHLLNFRARFVGLNHIRATCADEGSVAQPWLKPACAS